MPEEHNRYEEVIENILESSADLPDPPKNSPELHVAFLDEVKEWVFQGISRRLGVLTPVKLLIASLVAGVLFLLLRFSMFAWIGLVCFIAAYVVFFVGKPSNKI